MVLVSIYSIGISEITKFSLIINNRLLRWPIGDLNQNVTSAIEDLTYVTEQNTRMLSEQLNSINSGINVSNLISAVNTYQTYKIKDSLKIKE